MLSLPSGLKGLFSSSELTQYAEAFIAADADNSGTLDIHELKDIIDKLPKQIQDCIPLDDMEQMLRSLDVNGDGVVSFEEILCCIAVIVYAQDSLISDAYDARDVASFVDSIWEKYDVNGNGDLEADEVKNFIQDFTNSQDKLSDEECEIFVSSLDEDGNGTIQKAELIHFISRGTRMSLKQRESYIRRGGK
eukprot:g5077.t1